MTEMNVDPSRAAGKGASSSQLSGPKANLPNGLYSHNNLSNNFSFPTGGIPSLRLPVVVVISSGASISDYFQR